MIRALRKMTNSSFVLPFGDPRCKAVSLSGGKGGSIATMLQEGLPVPPGFVITSAAFLAAVDEGRLRDVCRVGDTAEARTIIAAARPPTAIVAEHYAALDGSVAVRSSACAETPRQRATPASRRPISTSMGFPQCSKKL